MKLPILTIVAALCLLYLFANWLCVLWYMRTNWHPSNLIMVVIILVFLHFVAFLLQTEEQVVKLSLAARFLDGACFYLFYPDRP